MRKFLGSLLRSVCEWVTINNFLPLREITRGDGSPYLNRYYLFGKSPSYFPMEVKPRLGFLPTTFLHHFVDSDNEEELHNHPWKDSLSFILVGGYVEQRKQGLFLTSRILKPLSFNRIRADDFHRVSLVEKDAWSIFITGKKAQSWGFWSKDTHEFIPHREYMAWREKRDLLRNWRKVNKFDVP